jgi:hypothetical protein
MLGLLLVLLAAGGAAPAPPRAGAGIQAAVTAGAAAPTAAAPRAAPPAATTPAWGELVPGMELGTFASSRARGKDDRIRVLRLDPKRFRLRLLNASAPTEGRPLSARGWADRHHLAAVINSSMYQADLRSSVSLMRRAGHVNNPRLSKDKAVLAFDPVESSVPPVQIIDRECQDFETVSRAYRTLVQSIRMVSCHGGNVWSPQPRAWSTAAIGIDGRGRVLFIHARAPHTTHDLIATLLELPIDLKRAMYAEGGLEAQLFVRAGGREFEFLGTVDDSGADEGPTLAWPIPNVIGAEAIEGPAGRPAPPPVPR